MGSELRDARGCLTPDGLRTFREAPPGRAPAELATHVAGCGRCQNRALLADEGVTGPGKRKQAPPVWRIFALFLAGVMMALVLYSFTRRMLDAVP